MDKQIKWARWGLQLGEEQVSNLKTTLSSAVQARIFFFKKKTQTRTAPLDTHTHLLLKLADRKNCSRESGFREPEGARGHDKPVCPSPLVSEWVCVCVCVCVCVHALSPVWLFATPWTVAHQVPLSMWFSRQVYWNGLRFPTPGDLPNPGLEPVSLLSPALAAVSPPYLPPPQIFF